MTIPLNSNLEEMFEKYLNIINPMLSAKKLKPLELRVLAKLLYAKYSFKHLSKKELEKLLFSSQLKKNIRTSVENISEASYNNIILSLRKKEIINNKEITLIVPIENNKIELFIIVSLIKQ